MVIITLGFVLLVPAAPVIAAGKAEEDPTLPRPAKGQSPEYYSQLARVHAAFRLYESAEKLQLRALELEKNRAKKERLSYELFERIYCRAGQWDKAAQEILRTMTLAAEGNIAQKRTYHIDRARVLKEAGRTEQYITELENVAKISQTEEERKRSLQALHQALKTLKKLGPKITQYEAAVKKNPKDEITLRILADIYAGSGLLNLPGRAIEKYEQIRTFKPNDVSACEHLAGLYSATAKKDKAVEMFELLMKFDQRRFESYFVPAAALLLSKGRDQAVAWCEKIRGQYPRQHIVPVKIGNIYGEQGDHAKAVPYYEKAVPLIPGNLEKLSVYIRLIESQMSVRQYAAAEKNCRQAMLLATRSPSQRRRLGRLLEEAVRLRRKSRGK